MALLIWFITGCSSGFGRELVRATHIRGDKVIATARNPIMLQALKDAGPDTMTLDVTAPLDELRVSAKEAHGLYGRIDVYGIQGRRREQKEKGQGSKGRSLVRVVLIRRKEGRRTPAIALALHDS